MRIHSSPSQENVAENSSVRRSSSQEAEHFQRADPAAEFHKLRAGLADGRSVISPEIRNCRVIGHQPPDQPHHLDIAPGLAFQPAAGRDPIEVSVDEQLQQN